MKTKTYMLVTLVYKMTGEFSSSVLPACIQFYVSSMYVMFKCAHEYKTENKHRRTCGFLEIFRMCRKNA